MSQPDDFDSDDPVPPPPLDLSKWRTLPTKLMFLGGALAVLGVILSYRNDGLVEFGYAWLLAFMFFLSIGLGALFLVLAHHLFDAGWSVPTRRFCEHIATLLFPWLFLLWLPIGILAPKLFPWMTSNPLTDHALKAKQPLFTTAGFYIISLGCFAAWWFLTNRLRYWSLRQDEATRSGATIAQSWFEGVRRIAGLNQDNPGIIECTLQMRKFSCVGIWAFAFSMTLAAIMWMKALQHQWFSTMYGVYYFAGSVWLTLATVYVITMILDRQRILTEVLHEHQFYFIGSLLFAFTVFYAYVTFAQYFIIWNANMPEETFWYVIREVNVNGEHTTWFWAGMVIIFGHFFLPFLSLLRIDVKSKFPIMIALAAWAWLMHFVDMAFNIWPVIHREGVPFQWLWLPLGIMALMGGFLADRFLKKFASAPPFPVKDPRLIEAMGLYHPVPTQISGGELDQTDDMRDALIKPKGGH